MLLEWFSLSGTNKTIRAGVHMGELKLKPETAQYHYNLRWRFTHQQEYDLKHAAHHKATGQTYTSNHIEGVELSSQSPHLNPIENLWEHLKTDVNR